MVIRPEADAIYRSPQGFLCRWRSHERDGTNLTFEYLDRPLRRGRLDEFVLALSNQYTLRRLLAARVMHAPA